MGPIMKKLSNYESIKINDNLMINGKEALEGTDEPLKVSETPIEVLEGTDEPLEVSETPIESSKSLNDIT